MHHRYSIQHRCRLLMMKGTHPMFRLRSTALLFAALVLLVSKGFAQEDEPGTKDPALFNRMTGYYITNVDTKEFDAFKFFNGKALVTLEGKVTTVTYRPKESLKPVPSELQIRRNYSNAIKKIGGKILFEGRSESYEDNRYNREVLTACITRENVEIWTDIWSMGDDYTVTVLEKQLMRQDIAASDMLDAINKNGFIALDIHFDTGKSMIKPESESIVEQIVQLLKTNADLKLSVEGHTDNVGDAKSNLKLSEERAKSVVAALVKAGIQTSRLSSAGFGQDRPVADNRSEEGRAKNRRVELVKK
jgi:outer membrane protein OmpA-like peptidoglycan-associated protein